MPLDHLADQELLRELCQQTLAFENHSFQHYRTYLLDLLEGTNDERQFAAERLTQVVYTDDVIVGMLLANAQTANAGVRTASTQALALIDRKAE